MAGGLVSVGKRIFCQPDMNCLTSDCWSGGCGTACAASVPKSSVVPRMALLNGGVSSIDLSAGRRGVGRQAVGTVVVLAASRLVRCWTKDLFL